MPMPQPRGDEKRRDFISRFMSDETMMNDYPDQKQRLAVAFTQWREAHKDLDPLTDALIQSMAEELKAAEVYKERANALVNLSEPTARVLLHVAQEEYEHFDEFLDALDEDFPVSSAELEVRFVGPDILGDFKGMNPAFAKLVGFEGCGDEEILILEGMGDAETQETIDHERQEYDAMISGVPYWPIHFKLIQKEEAQKAMKYKDAKRLMAVKFVDEEKGIIEGVYAPFGGPLGGKDLQGEYFDKDTDFCETWFKSRPILYHHGMDDSIKAEVIGHDLETKVLDNGRWLRAQLDKSVAYWNEIKTLIKEGRMFFSSGAVPHLVTKAVDGKLLRWPWVETSLTVSPANPLATVDSLKAVEFLKLIGATGEELKNIIKEVSMDPITKQVKSMSDQEKRQMLSKNAEEMFGSENEHCYVDDVYPEEVVMQRGDKLYKMTYSVGEDGKVAFGQPMEVLRKTVYMPASKSIVCPNCKATVPFSVPEPAGTPAADPKVEGTKPKPAGDTQPAATNPGVGQGMAPETHVSTSSVDTTGQSGQHGGATPAPAKPEGDVAGKGETPKPVAANQEKEPEPPKATTQASDNTASSTGAVPGKSVETAGKATEVKVEVDANKAVEAIKAQTEGLKTMLAEHLKSVEGSVKEAVKPLEERIKALESQPANPGPIRRALNPANPVEEDPGQKNLKKILDDPNTPQAVKAYVGEKLAADEISELIAKGPQRIGRQTNAG